MKKDIYPVKDWRRLEVEFMGGGLPKTQAHKQIASIYSVSWQTVYCWLTPGCIEKRRLSSAKYFSEHKEKKNKDCQEYYDRNSEAIKRHKFEFYHGNIDRVRSIARASYYKKTTDDSIEVFRFKRRDENRGIKRIGDLLSKKGYYSQLKSELMLHILDVAFMKELVSISEIIYAINKYKGVKFTKEDVINEIRRYEGINSPLMEIEKGYYVPNTTSPFWDILEK